MIRIKYQPQQFESKWVDQWEREKVYQTPKLGPNDKKRKVYCLSMFPYPSGAGLHVGHVRIYTATDVMARYFRMKGKAVLHPMGWDAFGLPAENAAIKAKKNPIDMVPKNIANFKKQMKRLGFSYDWNREFSTTDPEYYRWTQWLFIQFFKMGLLYKKKTPINYCPKCKTGLAEEEVLPDGTHERCGSQITKKQLPQWIFRITKYADRLLSDLQGLDWPEGILAMQKNWIGRSEGTEVKFKVQASNLKDGEIKVFTTRVDTIYGVTALVLAPEHRLVGEILALRDNLPNREEIRDYVEKAKRKLDLIRTDLSKEKTGIFTGFYGQHPLTGERIPVWIADYVLGWYGGGAVMVVPAHDERDFEFAKKFNLSIKTVIKPRKIANHGREKNVQLGVFTDYGILVNSGEFDGLTSQEAIKKISERLEKLNLGKRAVSYKLRDWIFSRQRYWGEPIPMVYCRTCAQRKISYWDTGEGKRLLNDKDFKNLELKINDLYGWFPVSESELPIKLPYVKSYQPTETGQSPLAKIDSFVKTKCPNCGGPARRETDTMPNWAGSCWYFLAFAFADRLNSNSNVQKPEFKNSNFRTWNLEFNPLMKDWLPVDWYLGGAEHAVLHLLYSRFWIKALQDLKLLDFSEPFLRLRSVGMVLAEDHRKMSKSLGNVINPDDVVSQYGADTLRIYEMFMAPFSSEISWSTEALQGGYRFLTKIWQIYHNSDKLTSNKNKEDKNLVAKLQKTILKVSSDITNVKFNTAIATMMGFIKAWEKRVAKQQKGELTGKLSLDNAKKFLQILAPFAPFITEEIWREVFGEKKSIHLSSWPEVKKLILDEQITIPIQVDGKLRGTIKVKREKLKDKSYLENLALKQEKINKYLRGREYKLIYLEGRILNFVLK